MLKPQIGPPNIPALVPGVKALRGPARVAFTGTSIMAGGPDITSSNVAFNADGTSAGVWLGRHAGGLMRAANGRMRAVCMAAIGGTYISSANNANAYPWLEYQLPKVIAAKATHCFINTGTNEMSAIGAGAAIDAPTLATYKSQITQGCQLLMAAGCLPILETIPPKRDQAGATLTNQTTSVQKFNDMLVDVAEELRIPLADMYGACVAASNAWLTNGSTDNIHPNGSLAYSIYSTIWNQVQYFFPHTTGLERAYVNAGNGSTIIDNIVNGIISGPTGSNSEPGSWWNNTGSGTLTTTDWSPTGSAAVGQTFVDKGCNLAFVTSSNTKYMNTALKGSMPAEGTRLLFSAYLGVPTNGGGNLEVSMVLTDGTNSFKSALVYQDTTTIGTFTGPVYQELEVVCPPSLTGGTLYAGITSSSTTAGTTLQIGHVTVRALPALS